MVFGGESDRPMHSYRYTGVSNWILLEVYHNSDQPLRGKSPKQKAETSKSHTDPLTEQPNIWIRPLGPQVGDAAIRREPRFPSKGWKQSVRLQPALRCSWWHRRT
jgi:hypothetical protein